MPTESRLHHDYQETNWQAPGRQRHDMIRLDDMESQKMQVNNPQKKSSVAQTEVATPWLHQHQSTSAHFTHGKSSQTEIPEDFQR